MSSHDSAGVVLRAKRDSSTDTYTFDGASVRCTVLEGARKRDFLAEIRADDSVAYVGRQ